jgi:hypothetical protein
MKKSALSQAGFLFYTPSSSNALHVQLMFVRSFQTPFQLPFPGPDVVDDVSPILGIYGNWKR